MGIRLRLEAAAAVLGMPMPAAVDLDLGADELWGTRAHALQDRLADASSAGHAAAILEGIVADRLTDAPALDPVAAEAVTRLMSRPSSSVAATAAALFTSERQFRRRFEAHLTREAARLEGRSPRTFLRESEQRCGCGHDHNASYGPLLRALK